MAALGDYFGGVFGQAFPQGQWQANALTASATANTWGYEYDFATATYTRKSDGHRVTVETAPKAFTPESALAWLDRRVSEICVKL